MPKSSRNACMRPRSGALSLTYDIPLIGEVTAVSQVCFLSRRSAQDVDHVPVQLVDRIAFCNQLLFERVPDDRFQCRAQRVETGRLQIGAARAGEVAARDAALQ